jgi:hypothetical protein
MCPRSFCNCGGHTYCLENSHSSHTVRRRSVHVLDDRYSMNPADRIEHISVPGAHYTTPAIYNSAPIIQHTNIGLLHQHYHPAAPPTPPESQSELFTRIADHIGYALAPTSLAARQALVEEPRLDAEAEHSRSQYQQLDWQIRRLAFCSEAELERIAEQEARERLRVITRIHEEEERQRQHDRRGRRSGFMELEFRPSQTSFRSSTSSESSCESSELVVVDHAGDHGDLSISVERRRQCRHCHDTSHRSKDCHVVEYEVHGRRETHNHRSRTPRGSFRHVLA